MLNALSIDVEEYFHAQVFAGFLPAQRWEQLPGRVRDASWRLLELCAACGVKATYFVLGWVAERYPELIREIAARGHEIACHGYAHRLVYRQSPAEFRADVRRSKSILEDVSGRPVLGFRAPTFSITSKSLWALEILAEEGFCYDSSIFPIRHDRYGIPGAERFPHKILSAQDFYEFPPSTVRLGCLNLPCAGGGYLRLFPYRYTAWSIERLNRQRRPALVYLHPWELDAQQPRLGLRGICAWRHYHNIGQMEGRLRRLLQDFNFAPLRVVLGV